MKHLVVAGGGAAGFFCAVNAARLAPDLRVTIVEKSSKLLSKVRISGGGRCNVTHNLNELTEMSNRYPRGQHFTRKAFHQFFTSDTIEWFASRGVSLKAEDDGRMFPVSNTSESIVQCMLREASSYGVQIKMNAAISSVTASPDGFKIVITGRDVIEADFLCIATGGYPKADQFAWIEALGHSIETPLPSLFTFNLPHHPLKDLMGVAAPHARVKVAGTKIVEEGPVLITHWGLSGPAVLRCSAWGARELAAMQYRYTARISWNALMREDDWRGWFSQQKLHHGLKQMQNLDAPEIPSRLWLHFLEQAAVASVRMVDLPAKAMNQLIKQLTDYEVEVSGKTTYKEEFVTAGGVKLKEIDPATMMSRKVDGLYFAGEVMDVDGITGGFNFQHAWSSGWIAANAIARRV